MHVCVCVCGERERERKIYYKELDHTIVKLCENWLADSKPIEQIVRKGRLQAG